MLEKKMNKKQLAFREQSYVAPCAKVVCLQSLVTVQSSVATNPSLSAASDEDITDWTSL